MDLRDYMRIAHRRERQRLARDCRTTVGYLYQIAGRHRRPGVALALRVEGATRGAVCRCRLRPDLFAPGHCPLADHANTLQHIWPAYPASLRQPPAHPERPMARQAGSGS